MRGDVFSEAKYFRAVANKLEKEVHDLRQRVESLEAQLSGM